MLSSCCFILSRTSLFQVILRRLLSPEIDMKGTATADDAAETYATAAAAGEGQGPSSAGNGDSGPEEASEEGGETSPSPPAEATTEAVRQE